MFRTISLCLLGALLLGAADAPQNSALDKPTMEAYVRHLYVLQPQLMVTIGDPKPSAMPGFKEVRVRIAQGAQAQEVPLYVSNDGKKIVQGIVYDIASNPFKPELDKLKTQFQPALGTAGAPGAMAGRCVFQQNADAFWEYHDYVFAHQDAITADNLKDQVLGWAKGVKDVDAIKLGACIDNKATQAEVEKEIAEAQALDVGGTPTMFINGRRIGQVIEWPNLKTIIDAEIEYQKTAQNAGDDCGCEVKLDIPGMPQTQAPGVPSGPPPPAKKK